MGVSREIVALSLFACSALVPVFFWGHSGIGKASDVIDPRSDTGLLFKVFSLYLPYLYHLKDI
ncbi:MAG: hypothetical protein PHP87_05415 [Syntrophomonas sp.]|uniref:hypothetical protein n=1 Tax=Syntrophomonas sp. TaxID=2053627 RepID=UPI00260D2967|nr:hypothetical protein [Syntrophomonas sp.]MDD4626505.1 hypothetical protein [Syntrophomonas sp.]